MKIIDRIKDIKSVLGPQIELLKFQKEWRESNQHNNTRVGRLFPKDKVHVGKYTYGTLNVVSYGNERERLEIGNYCSIAGDTVFILSGEHDYRRISTFPFSRVALHRMPESITKGPIIIEDDVWIGYGCLFLSGIKVGRGAVIGAGSIVNKNIPPYAIFAGGRIIKYRFSQDVIKKLLDNPLPVLSEKRIAEMLELLERPITDVNIDEILYKINE